MRDSVQQKLGHTKGRSQSTFTRRGRKVVQKCSDFCQRSYHRKCQHMWVGGQKEQESCQRSL